MNVNDENSSVRIDKWLWAARFFKTRSQAGQAVQGGKIHLNGARVKPSRMVKAGDQLEIRKSDQIFRVTVKGVNRFRRPAVEARELYEESEESIRDREAQAHLRKLIKAPGSAPAKRPDKRDRRKIREFIRKD
jgi:ribosome-associated heat shock protein Hsp15